jgi:hypothetical protein
MSYVKEFHIAIERKRPGSGEWDFQEKIAQYEISATEYVISGKSAWLVKVEGQQYWADNENISLAKFDGHRLEKFADPVDMNLQGCIREALTRFEKLAKK